MITLEVISFPNIYIPVLLPSIARVVSIPLPALSLSSSTYPNGVADAAGPFHLAREAFDVYAIR